MTPRKISLFVLALLLAACGCVPVAWLPDSSGFVCSLENQGNATFRLMHYDLAKKKCTSSWRKCRRPRSGRPSVLTASRSR